MNGVNLIPQHRRLARQRRLRIRRWALGCAAYAIALIAACIGVHATCSPDSRSISTSLAATNRQAAELTTQVNATRAQLAELTGKLQTIQFVTNQPDWSILLAALSHATTDDTVLNTVSLEPIPDRSPPPSKPVAAAMPAHPKRWKLDLAGHCASQPAVSQLITRLQQTGLFSEIQLQRTNREPFLTGHAVAFQLHCTLGEHRSSP